MFLLNLGENCPWADHPKNQLQIKGHKHDLYIIDSEVSPCRRLAEMLKTIQHIHRQPQPQCYCS